MSAECGYPLWHSKVRDRTDRHPLRLHNTITWHPRGDQSVGLVRVKENSSVAIPVLIVDDVEEIRDVITLLLESDGYFVEAARSEKQAIQCALRTPPQLILVNLAGSPEDVIASARSISQNASLQDHVPVVLFCVEGIEGAEVHLGGSLYSTWPDNFNHLRQFLQRLLNSSPAY
jgi:CheY-like chemotaxis protein